MTTSYINSLTIDKTQFGNIWLTQDDDKIVLTQNEAIKLIAHLKEDDTKTPQTLVSSNTPTTEQYHHTTSTIIQYNKQVGDKKGQTLQENLIALGEVLQPIIETANVRFGSLVDSQIWMIGTHPHQATVRIGVKEYGGKMRLGMEVSDLRIERWDGSNWIGYADPFSDDAYDNGDVVIYPLERVPKRLVSCIIERLPGFILEYCRVLKNQRRRCTDFEKKVKQIKAILKE